MKLSKKLTAAIIVIAIIALIFTSGCMSQKTNYTIGVDAALSPWEHIDNDGNPQGINIELMNLIAEDQGFEVTYYVPKDGLWEQDLVNGIIDTEGTIVMTPERMEKYQFAEMPFEPTRYLVIARSDSGITLDDVLAGKTSIAIFGNSVYEEYLKKHFGKDYDIMLEEGKIILKNTADELAFSVLSHESDSAIAGSMTLSSQLNLYQPLKFIGYIGEPKKLGFVLRKDDTELHNKIVKGIENIKNTQEFQNLVRKYNMQYKKDTYIVGIDANNKPWTYKNDDGSFSGFNVEMMEWIANVGGFNVEFKPYNSALTLNAVVVGDIDMWAGEMAITDDRLQYAAFSNPYYSSGIGVGVKPNSRLTKSDFDSDSAKIVTIYKTCYAEWLEDYLGTEKYEEKVRDGSIILAIDENIYYDALSSGKADFAVNSEAKIEADASNGEMKIIFVEENAEDLGIAMSNGNIVLQNLINSALEEFKSSDKRAELVAKYKV